MIGTLARTQTTMPPLTTNATLRWDVVNRVIHQLGPLERVVEIGCGQGAAAVRLAQRADEYIGYEPDASSCEIARFRLQSIPSANAENELLPQTVDREVDLLCAFEVLEHIEFDEDALCQWSQWVKPGGHILLSVPAHESRFGAADRAVGHYRRYSREGLAAKIEAAGFSDIRVLGYGMPLGYILETIRNRAIRPEGDSKEERSSASGRVFQPPGWTSSLIQLGTLPFRLMQRPFAQSRWATGWVAVGRRV